MSSVTGALKYRQTWTVEEDSYLKKLVPAEGRPNWNQITTIMNNTFPQRIRSAKQCRERYINYSHYSDDSEQMAKWKPTDIDGIFGEFEKYGTSWARIAQSLQGKSENAVKNKFYGTLRKAVRKMNKVIRIQSLKKKKKLRYESVIRVIEAADCFHNLASDLKEESLRLRRKIFAMVKQNQSQLSNQQIFELIQDMNRFNLATRSFRAKRFKKGEESNDGQASQHVDSAPTVKAEAQEKCSVSGEREATIDEPAGKGQNPKPEEEQNLNQVKIEPKQIKMSQAHLVTELDFRQIMSCGEHKNEEDLSMYFYGMISRDCSPLDEFNLFGEAKLEFPY